MEIEKLTTREQLKAYFKTGKYPTESQFSDLIDSITLKEDVMTYRETIVLANRLASITNGYIGYHNKTSSDEEFSLVVSSQDEEDQIITLSKVNQNEGIKQYFFGTGPYTIRAKEFSTKGLKETEYYYLRYQINPNYMLYKMFGNTLPTIPDGFEFGIPENKMFYFEINKIDYGKKINIVNTNIKFINKTDSLIKYKIEAGFWSHIYTSEDVVTNHYDIGDYLNFNYRADLTGTTKPILCKVYDEDTDQLLMTTYLSPGFNNENNSGGSSAYNVRNIRIECNYETPQ